MSSFPGSPKLVKAGLVLVDPVSGAVLRVIPLQYNPETLTRTLQVRGTTGEAGDRTEALRLTGPPSETIKLDNRQRIGCPPHAGFSSPPASSLGCNRRLEDMAVVAA